MEAAIAASQPGSTALNLDQALVFARHIQGQDGRPRRRDRLHRSRPHRAARSRFRPRAAAQSACDCDCGQRGKRGPPQSGHAPCRRPIPTLWEIYVLARNYGNAPHTVDAVARFRPAGTGWARGRRRAVRDSAARRGEGDRVRIPNRAPPAFWASHLLPTTAFPATITPSWSCRRSRRCTSSSIRAQPELLRPVLAATPRVTAVYRTPEEYRPDDKGLLILDRFVPPQRPAADSIWIDPPARVRRSRCASRVEQAAFHGWDSGASGGCRAAHARFQARDHASVFEAGGERRAGRRSGGGSRDCGARRQAEDRGVRLPPGALRDALRTGDAAAVRQSAALDLAGDFPPLRKSPAASVGAVKLVDGTGDRRGQDVKVTGDDGSAVPFTLRDRTLNFFSGAPGAREGGGGRPRVSLLADAAELWDIEVGRRRPRPRKGVPRFTQVLEASTRSLAVAGACWARSGCWRSGILYGRFRRCGAARGRTLLMRSAAQKRSEAAAMTFDHPRCCCCWRCCLVAWAAWEWRQSSRRLALILKAAAFVCIALALAGPRLTVYQSKVAVACWPTPRPAFRRRICSANRPSPTQVERPRAATGRA